QLSLSPQAGRGSRSAHSPISAPMERPPHPDSASARSDLPASGERWTSPCCAGAVLARWRHRGLLAESIEYQRFPGGFRLQLGKALMALLQIVLAAEGRLHLKDFPGRVPVQPGRSAEHENLLGTILRNGALNQPNRQITQQRQRYSGFV